MLIVVPVAVGVAVVPVAVLIADNVLPLPAQLGIAIPLMLALGAVGTWMMRKIDRLEKQNAATEDKLLDRVLPALTEAAQSQSRAAEAMTRIADLSQRMLDQQEKLIAAVAVLSERRPGA